MSPDVFAREWARVKPWLEQALEHSGSVDTIEDVHRGVIEGKCQLFLRPTGAAVTLVESTAKTPTLQIWLAGGDMAAMEEMLPDFEKVARILDCGKLAFLGRTGWQRTFLTNEGFKPSAVLMEKTLSPIEVANG